LSGFVGCCTASDVNGIRSSFFQLLIMVFFCTSHRWVELSALDVQRFDLLDTPGANARMGDVLDAWLKVRTIFDCSGEYKRMVPSEIPSKATSASVWRSSFSVSFSARLFRLLVGELVSADGPLLSATVAQTSEETRPSCTVCSAMARPETEL